jgi:hypothetical protein
MTLHVVSGGSAPRAVLEIADQLAGALGWPPTRPARTLVGDRARLITSVTIVAGSDDIDAVVSSDPNTAVVLATPAGSSFARTGRRNDDDWAGTSDSAAWARQERTVLDASELLAGGSGGFDDQLLAAVGLQAADPVLPVYRDEYKIACFVPATALEDVRQAMFHAGAGWIGAYSECSWSTAGTGTFRPGEHANPTIGVRGARETVEELRVEVVCQTRLRDRVVRALVAAHPYEEPAYDCYPTRTPGRTGIGRRVSGSTTSAFVGALTGLLPTSAIEQSGSTRQGRGSIVAMTTGSATPLIEAVLDDREVGTLVCTSASASERALLVQRGIDLVCVDRATIHRTTGNTVADDLARVLDFPVSFAAALAFPGAGG